MFAYGAVIITQLVLGITTLLLAVPVPRGVLHQFTGVLALTAALVATQRAMASGATVEAPRDVAAPRLARAAAPVEAARVRWWKRSAQRADVVQGPPSTPSRSPSTACYGLGSVAR